jgi:ABC-type antimicrobial peptide transport system permease subunit
MGVIAVPDVLRIAWGAMLENNHLLVYVAIFFVIKAFLGVAIFLSIVPGARSPL